MLYGVYWAPKYNTFHVSPKLVTLYFWFSTKVTLPRQWSTEHYFSPKPNTTLPEFKEGKGYFISLSKWICWLAEDSVPVLPFCLWFQDKTPDRLPTSTQHLLLTYLMSSKERRAELQRTSITTDFFSLWFLRSFAHLGQTAMEKPLYPQSTTRHNFKLLEYMMNGSQQQEHTCWLHWGLELWQHFCI